MNIRNCYPVFKNTYDNVTVESVRVIKEMLIRIPVKNGHVVNQYQDQINKVSEQSMLEHDMNVSSFSPVHLSKNGMVGRVGVLWEQLEENRASKSEREME